MPKIEADFSVYIPRPSALYQYLEVLKEQHFIKGISVDTIEGQHFLTIFR